MKFKQIVLLHRGRDQLGFRLARHRRRRLNVFQRREIVLLLDLGVLEVVDGRDDEVRDDVEDAYVRQDLRIFKVDFAGDLHHAQGDDQVLSAISTPRNE